ncbi:ankyrin repeat domain-containing protein 49 isoform X2 [Denticeps clupeoides]|uniref:Ankyrin repeat domain-containing protein 49 n=2 Tax=Denticeps clupeoides TaxID=299321 RepID=A0A8C3ZY85_9TELE|nr:ankyrin repeat domain-containing protein 49 isoform X2 [Denticeps clupeoides]XP_028817867.1 ankyrin repeat domain-containing protein 49 isoform X2 [Denticeps clupeoides]XP_028817868.1 ankyrin repeat domain-containing protein 49 isoform X2 [Denticeps clupeoides]XP_028817869.1 ankyrin repeat domain-containing protein 49 isoform X2 [Denticeps clupeoides]
MEFPGDFNQLELLQTHCHLIPRGTTGPWNEEEEEEENKEEHTEEWYLQEECRMQETCCPADFMLWAAENNRLSVVPRLLSLDSSLIGCCDSDGYTALHRASYEGHAGMVQVLMDAGAELEARTADGWTPLHCACRWDKVAVASCLLWAGALVNSHSHGKVTPLHLAAGNAGAGKTLELMLMHRQLQAGLCNNSGETAYTIACRSSKHFHLFEITDACNTVST